MGKFKMKISRNGIYNMQINMEVLSYIKWVRAWGEILKYVVIDMLKICKVTVNVWMEFIRYV